VGNDRRRLLALLRCHAGLAVASLATLAPSEKLVFRRSFTVKIKIQNSLSWICRLFRRTIETEQELTPQAWDRP
jgi:hypothetical protein